MLTRGQSRSNEQRVAKTEDQARPISETLSGLVSTVPALSLVSLLSHSAPQHGCTLYHILYCMASYSMHCIWYINVYITVYTLTKGVYHDSHTLAALELCFTGHPWWLIYPWALGCHWIRGQRLSTYFPWPGLQSSVQAEGSVWAVLSQSGLLIPLGQR